MRTSSIEVTLDLAADLPLHPRRRRPAAPGAAEPDHQCAAVAAGPAGAAPHARDEPLRRRRPTGCASRSPTTDRAFREHLRARVFEPYFTTKPTGVGTGVGLAVSLGIVEAHGGTLTVDCPADGGAVFTIALPVGAVGDASADAAPAARASARPAHDPRRRRRGGDPRCAGRDPDRRAASRGRRRLRARSAGAHGRRALRRDPHRHAHARSRRTRAVPRDRAALARPGRARRLRHRRHARHRHCASSSSRAAVR